MLRIRGSARLVIVYPTRYCGHLRRWTDFLRSGARLYCKNLNLLEDRNVVQMLCLQGQVGGWAHSGELPEIMDKMRLIKIAAVTRYIHPIEFLALVDVLQSLLKPAYTTEELGRKSGLVAEELNKATRADTDLVCHRRDRRRGMDIAEQRQGIAHRTMPRQRPERLRHQARFQHLELLLRGRGLEQLLTQQDRLISPQVCQRDMLVVQLLHRQREKRKCSAWLEMNAHHGVLLCRIDYEEVGMRTTEQRPRQPAEFDKVVAIVDPSFVLAKVDDQLDRSIRHQPLFLVGARREAIIEPEQLHKLIQRRLRDVAEEK